MSRLNVSLESFYHSIMGGPYDTPVTTLLSKHSAETTDFLIVDTEDKSITVKTDARLFHLGEDLGHHFGSIRFINDKAARQYKHMMLFSTLADRFTPRGIEAFERTNSGTLATAMTSTLGSWTPAMIKAAQAYSMNTENKLVATDLEDILTDSTVMIDLQVSSQILKEWYDLSADLERIQYGFSDEKLQLAVLSVYFAKHPDINIPVPASMMTFNKDNILAGLIKLNNEMTLLQKALLSKPEDPFARQNIQHLLKAAIMLTAQYTLMARLLTDKESVTSVSLAEAVDHGITNGKISKGLSGFLVGKFGLTAGRDYRELVRLSIESLSKSSGAAASYDASECAVPTP